MLYTELQYFTPIISYSTLIKNTDVDFCIYENYHRRSFRNRCIIAGANGPISLSVPIAGGRNKKAIYKDVRIDYSTDWRQQHWRSIFSAYGNSPWFFHFAESLENLYTQKADFLVDWNFLCMDWVNRSLGVSMSPLGELGNYWKFSGPLVASGEEEIMDWRDKVLPANFQSLELGPFPVYTQVFEERFGFQPNLSILDFILCCGKQQFNRLLK